jgi:hypothetical protein
MLDVDTRPVVVVGCCPHENFYVLQADHRPKRARCFSCKQLFRFDAKTMVVRNNGKMARSRL